MVPSCATHTYLVRDVIDESTHEVQGLRELQSKFLPGTLIKAWPQGTMHKALALSTLYKKLKEPGDNFSAHCRNKHFITITRTK